MTESVEVVSFRPYVVPERAAPRLGVWCNKFITVTPAVHQSVGSRVCLDLATAWLDGVQSMRRLTRS
jgi:hypothetical protein